MSITADFHLHSSFSGDSDTPMEDMILHGIKKGMTHMCFTEHLDMDFVYSSPEDEGVFELNTDSYLYDLIILKEKYQKEISISFGVELGLQPHLTKEIAKYVKSYDFDFIIGSTHICNRRDPYYPAFYAGRSVKESYLEYFESVYENLKKYSSFDVAGHLDYIVRYGPTRDTDYQYGTYRDIIDSILKLIIDKEKGLELNTGGLKNKLKDANPCKPILKRYRELGGEVITIGSDAHIIGNIAFAFDYAATVLKECGFGYYCTFKGRMPEYHKI